VGRNRFIAPIDGPASERAIASAHGASGIAERRNKAIALNGALSEQGGVVVHFLVPKAMSPK
jgi:hypothetical protein